MYPHEIRLRGPWQFRTIGSSPEKAGTLTPPGFWHHLGLPNYWGKVELRRPFNWVARLNEHDQVWLVCAKLVGHATLTLNGQTLGTHDSPWDSFRFDVTKLLGPRNELIVLLDTPKSDHSQTRYGSLGCSAADPDGTDRHGVGGILGGIHLSVENRQLQLERLEVETDWSPAGGILHLRCQCQKQFESTPVQMTLSLDGRIIHERQVPNAGELRIEVDKLAVEPWWPRGLGLAQLYSLLLRFESAGETLYERTFSVGFRHVEIDDSRVCCNGKVAIENLALARGELWPDRSFLPCFGENAAKPFEEWTLAKASWIRVMGHIAPDSFYSLCDRAGLLVEQDLAFAAEAKSLLQSEFSHHPSVVTWRPDPGNA